jgi:hypothetical protein
MRAPKRKVRNSDFIILSDFDIRISGFSFACFHHQQPVAWIGGWKLAGSSADHGHGGAVFASARIEPGD